MLSAEAQSQQEDLLNFRVAATVKRLKNHSKMQSFQELIILIINACLNEWQSLCLALTEKDIVPQRAKTGKISNNNNNDNNDNNNDNDKMK